MQELNPELLRMLLATSLPPTMPGHRADPMLDGPGSDEEIARARMAQFGPPSDFVPERPARMGSTDFGGEALDDVARALLAASQNMQPRTNVGRLAQGFAQGFGQVRSRRADQREAINAGENQRATMRTAANVKSQEQRMASLHKRKEAGEKLRNEHAQGLANHHRNMVRDKANDERQRQTAIDVARINASNRGSSSEAIGDDYDAVAEAIATYQASPILGGRMTKDVRGIMAALRRNHPDFDLARAVSDWNIKERFNASQESVRMQANRTATATVARHLKEFEELSRLYDKEVKKNPLKFVNASVIGAAEAGWLGEDAAAAAAGMQMQRGTLAKETAVLLGGGWAPHEKAERAADKMIGNVWGSKAQSAAFKTFKKIIRGRVDSSQELLPFTGGKTNPYLQDPTPLELYNNVFGEPAAGDSAIVPGRKYDGYRRGR